MGVIHAHAEETLPFGISKTTKMRAVINAGGNLGHDVPVWDIRDKFGDATNLLVTSMEHGRDLVGTMKSNPFCLMRGHGFAAARQTLQEVVQLAVFVPRNARVQMAAMMMGEYNPLSFNEIETRQKSHRAGTAESWRAWEYWALRAGVADLLGEEPR
jgi:HCOMODA/2-hydroxy-3-carboxy-muconic semialdehyde decarboxylase